MQRSQLDNISEQGPADRKADTELRRRTLGTALLIGLVLCVGIALRVRSFQKQAGLCRDEAALASNIVERDEWELLRPLGYHQAAPIGHLLLLKGATRWLGNNEMALRLPAQVASILTLFLYLVLARQCLSPWGQVLGLAFMGLAGPLVWYGVSAKQYSGDVLVTVALLIAGFRALQRQAGLGRFVLLGAVGVVAIGLSQPAVFVLGGIGITLIVGAVVGGRSREACGWIAVATLWLATFLPLYALIYRHYAGSENLTGFWTSALAPFPPRSLGELKWYYDHFFELFSFPLGLKFEGLAGACYLYGVFLLARKRDRRMAGMLIAPLIVTLTASALKKYPFDDRLMLFACPMLATLTAAGVAGIGDDDRTGGRVLRRIVATLLLIYPGYVSWNTMTSGLYLVHDIKPALAYVAEHWRDGDVVYLNFGAHTLGVYYANTLNYHNLRGKPFVYGVSAGDGASMEQQLQTYGKDLEQVQGKERVWFVFAMIRESQVPVFTYLLDRRGVRRDAYQGPGSTALLYDLRSAPSN
ncbi:MAG: glycosyltransferase family 39 protein [Planctomycetaceae bacterium]|nr:glycosyltransferase family 39 protein [Planctomycetaceae bacterium]